MAKSKTPWLIRKSWLPLDTWEDWQLKPAIYQDHTHYISIERLIDLTTDIGNIKNCIDFVKVSEKLELAVTRPLKIQFLSKIIRLTFYTSLGSAIALLIIPLVSLFYAVEHLSETYQISGVNGDSYSLAQSKARLATA